MPPVKFEPRILAGERPHTYALDRADIGTGHNKVRHIKYQQHFWYCCTQIHTPHLKPERYRVRSFSFSVLKESEKFVAGKEIPNYRTYITAFKSSCTRHSVVKTIYNSQPWKHHDISVYSAIQNIRPDRSVSWRQYTNINSI
jgi:hypothetical protein